MVVHLSLLHPTGGGQRRRGYTKGGQRVSLQCLLRKRRAYFVRNAQSSVLFRGGTQQCRWKPTIHRTVSPLRDSDGTEVRRCRVDGYLGRWCFVSTAGTRKIWWELSARNWRNSSPSITSSPAAMCRSRPRGKSTPETWWQPFRTRSSVVWASSRRSVGRPTEEEEVNFVRRSEWRYWVPRHGRPFW